ncbi:hypothetical protein ACEPAI_3861 [Sanghuangporus weigelae]
MGAVQSAIGTEATGAAAVGALVAGTATAYAVYKRVVPGVETTRAAAAATTTTATTTAESTSPGSGGKKGKGRKKKAAGAGNTSAVTTGGEKSDADAELDELLRRAKAEADVERARAEARRISASKGLIPGAFDSEHARDFDAASNTGLSSEVEGKGGARERKKKKGKKEAAPALAVSSSVSTKPAETPAEPAGASGASKKSKKRKGASKVGEPSAAAPPETSSSAAKTGTSKPSNASSSSHSSQALAVSLTLSDAPEDASWTRVSTRKKAAPSSSQQQDGKQQIGSVPGAAGQTDAELLTSDTNLTTSGVTDPENNTEEEDEDEDERSVREPENRRTFAERMLPRPRKTGVEDLEDEPLQPTLARVIRIKPTPDEKPPKGFSWGDYEEYAKADDGTSADGDADDAWEEVKNKKRTNRPASALTSSVDSLSYSSAPAAHSSTSSARAPTKTKKQRQNAERNEAARLEKEAAERDRLERLAQHRREQERARIAEQFKNAGSGRSKKNVSGGMKASVEDGKLVWDY